MFYSQCLFSSKGPLSAIWVAAHRKLKKALVLQTNIPSAIDYIIKEPIEVPIALRISGYLLLGVARIYSKKVDYLYDDCNEALTKLRNSWCSIRVSLPGPTNFASFHSITLPDKFELDALDLEELGYGTEESPNQHVKAYEHITVGEEPQDNLEVDMDYQMDEDAWHSVPADKSTLKDEVLPPHPIDADFDMDELDGYDYRTSREKVRENHIYEEILEPLMLEEVHERSEPQGCSVRFESWSAAVVECSHEEPSELRKMRNFDLEEAQIPIKESILLSSPVSEAPGRVPDSSALQSSHDVVIPEFIYVPTPKKKEQNWKSRKRKVPLEKLGKKAALFDEKIILPNEVMRHRLHDTTSILRTRGTVPLSGVDVWRASRISSMQEIFLEPFIPCVSPELREILMKSCVKPKTKVQFIEPSEIAEVNDSTSRFDRTPIVEEWFASVDEQKQLEMPEKKRLRPRQLMLPDDKPDSVQAGAPYARNELETFCGTSPDFNLNLLHEDSNSITADAGHQSDFDGLNHWSRRTKVVAQFLQNVYKSREFQNQGTGLNMEHILKGKTKKLCARFFMEILVLKTEDFVHVEQDFPYSDIKLTPLTKLGKLHI